MISGAMLAGKVAIVTGAGRGIGKAAAKLLAKHGAYVVVNDLSPEEAYATRKEIEVSGGRALAVAGSVTAPGFPEELVQTTIAEYKHLDILVNNAGFTWDGMLHRMKDEQFDEMLKVHVGAPFRLIRAAAPFMREVGKAEATGGQVPRDRSIVNVSSTSGLHGNVGQANYAAAKAGVVGLTKTVAKEWGPMGVRCNTIAFGWIDTRLTRPTTQEEAVDGYAHRLGLPQAALDLLHNPTVLAAAVPLARVGTVDEAAGGVLLLVSPHASYITGHTLEVTGGAGI